MVRKGGQLEKGQGLLTSHSPVLLRVLRVSGTKTGLISSPHLPSTHSVFGSSQAQLYSREADKVASVWGARGVLDALHSPHYYLPYPLKVVTTTRYARSLCILPHKADSSSKRHG